MGDAYARLAEAVERAKSGSPLAAVTVVAPNFGVARDVLMYLARTAGVANTSVLTVDQVVTRLAGPVLAPRVALPYPLLEGAVQRVLVDAPGVFSEVADQPITARALAHASQHLAAGTSTKLADLTPLVVEVIRIHREAVSAHSHRYFLPHEAYAAARARVHTLGQVIVFLPCESDPARAEFVAHLQRTAMTVDDDGADVTGTLVIHASDADDEVRAVTRLVRHHLAAGVRGHRIGVFYAAADPYSALLHEHLTQAAIAFHGPEFHTFVDRAAARSLQRLLQLDVNAMPRRELLAILAERAVHWQDEHGSILSGRQAELLTRRDVPIVGGTDWATLDTLDPHHHRYGTAMLLRRFVESLRRDLETIAGASTWPEASEAVTFLVDRYFRTDPRHPTDVATLRNIAAGLADLDGIAPPPTPQGIVDAVNVRAESQGTSVGTAGAGVAIGPISAGSGRNLEVCVVVGMAEGIVPAIRREDPLLPDAVTGVTPARRLKLQHRRLQLTIAAGECHRILTFPRGSLRGGAEKVPSRWLLPTLNTLTGAAVSTTGWQRDTERCDRVVTIESFDAAVQRCDERIGVGAASATEWRLRALAAVPARQRRQRLPDPVIARGMEMRGDRLWGRFTRFNGNLADTELIRVFDTPVAPTRLEDWVASPYVFFVRQILGVRLLEDPDDVTQIDPLTRGTVVHTVLERYIEELIAGAEGTLERLLQIGTEVLVQASSEAPGWLPQLWERDRALIHRDLTAWFDHDRADRAAGWLPIGAETGFGDMDEPPLAFDVGATQLHFRGKVDRIDRHRDDRIRVTDYKTGKTDPYLDQSADAPTAGCTRFQLPVYGLFARSLTPGGRVDARYWFTSTKGKFAEIGYEITDAVLATLRADLDFVHRSITSGRFPPKPGGRFDELTTLLGREGMQRSWQALLEVPELAEFVAVHTAETEAP